MSDKLFNLLSEKDLDIQLAEKLESLLASYMIYKQDDLIVDILNLINN